MKASLFCFNVHCIISTMGKITTNILKSAKEKKTFIHFVVSYLYWQNYAQPKHFRKRHMRQSPLAGLAVSLLGYRIAYPLAFIVVHKISLGRAINTVGMENVVHIWDTHQGSEVELSCVIYSNIYSFPCSHLIHLEDLNEIIMTV